MAQLTEQEILNANGRVIKNPDGTISVFTVNSVTSQLAPYALTQVSCQALGMSGVTFDTLTQKCRWSSDVDCTANSPFNLVLNPKGNDGTIFMIPPDETCTLSVDFDYLLKFSCEELTALATGQITGACSSIINVFESIGASMTIDVVNSTYTNSLLTKVYEEEFFQKIGTGNLYNYLSSRSGDTGFYICGSLTNNTTDTGCYPLNLYDLNVTGDTLNCGLAVNSILQSLQTESGLNPSDVATFKSNVTSNAFASEWQHFSTEITDPAIIDLIENQKIKLTIKLSGVCIDTCVLLDNIELNKNCTKVTRNDIFLTQSPGFELDRIIDNKKSWVANTERTHRTFDITKTDGTSRIRHTDYYLDDERQILNTKEIDLDIDIAAAIETDIWAYISDNPCILTGVTIGTTTCVKTVSVESGVTVVTSAETTITGTCCPVTAITSTTVVTTGATYSCPVGYSATPANDVCQFFVVSAATFSGSGPTIVTGSTNVVYGQAGTYFYPNIQGNGALPLYYRASDGLLVDQTGGTISAAHINNIAPYWGNPSNTITDGRLNNVGISASTTELLGFSKCIDIMSAGTYYIGMAADNTCRFSINGVLVVNFSSTTTGSNFNIWSVFPFELNSGLNIIEMEGQNAGSATAFGAEVYFPTSLAVLTGATSSGSSEANTLFSTQEKIGDFFDLGTTFGYSCPAGYALNNCVDPPVCTFFDEEPISATTGSTSATTTGYCTDMSCVTYTITSTTIVTTATTTTSGLTCIPMTYCCSEYCGDANLDINRLLLKPMSGISTIEDFQYYLGSELIDVKNRKIISGYPTLRMLYERYMDSLGFCATNSAKFDYSSMDRFANLIGTYWVDLIEQVIPATTIWGSTRIYTNTMFDEQKYQYKGYSSFFGTNSFGSIKSLSPVSGNSCSAEIITTVIQGSSTGTTMFLNAGDEHRYTNVYPIQMNSGSEFVGTVSIIGSALGPDVSDGGLIIISELLG